MSLDTVYKCFMQYLELVCAQPVLAPTITCVFLYAATVFILSLRTIELRLGTRARAALSLIFVWFSFMFYAFGCLIRGAK